MRRIFDRIISPNRSTSSNHSQLSKRLYYYTRQPSDTSTHRHTQQNHNYSLAYHKTRRAIDKSSKPLSPFFPESIPTQFSKSRHYAARKVFSRARAGNYNNACARARLKRPLRPKGDELARSQFSRRVRGPLRIMRVCLNAIVKALPGDLLGRRFVARARALCARRCRLC